MKACHLENDLKHLYMMCIILYLRSYFIGCIILYDYDTMSFYLGMGMRRTKNIKGQVLYKRHLPTSLDAICNFKKN